VLLLILLPSADNDRDDDEEFIKSDSLDSVDSFRNIVYRRRPAARIVTYAPRPRMLGSSSFDTLSIDFDVFILYWDGRRCTNDDGDDDALLTMLEIHATLQPVTMPNG
jgi:hypothetical protein